MSVKNILLAFTIVSGVSSKSLLSWPKQSVDTLENVLTYTFPTYHCVQILTDKSPPAHEILSQLYQASSNVSFINEIRTETCNGFILIAKHIKFVLSLLDNISLRYENRLLVLISEGHHKHLESLLMNPEKWFTDSEALIVIFGDQPQFYARKQPIEKLVRLTNIHGSWPVLHTGVKDFQNRTAVLGTFNCSPFSSFGPLDENGSPAWVGGMELKLVKDIFERVNLKMKIIVPNTEDMWGLFDGNKWKGGIMGLLSAGEIDIAFCGLWFTRDMVGTQTSSPLTQGCLKPLVPIPEYMDTRWLSVFKPFPNGLWLFIGASAAIAALTIFLFSRLQACVQQATTHRVNLNKNINCTLTESILLTVSIFLTTGGGSKKVRDSLRRVYIWWAIHGFLLTTAYSSCLITQLTSPEISTKMDTIRQLVENDYMWTSPIAPDVNDMIDFSDPWESTWAKRLRVIPNRQEEFDFLANEKAVIFGQQFGENSFCLDFPYPESLLRKFEVTSTCYGQLRKIGLVFRSGTPFFKPIQGRIVRYQSAGLLDKMLNDELDIMATINPYVREVFDFRKIKIKTKVKLKIGNLKGAFLLWGIGLAASTFVFIVEIFKKK